MVNAQQQQQQQQQSQQQQQQQIQIKWRKNAIDLTAHVVREGDHLSMTLYSGQVA